MHMCITIKIEEKEAIKFNMREHRKGLREGSWEGLDVERGTGKSTLIKNTF